MGLIEVLAGAIHHRLDGSAGLAQSRAFAREVIEEVRSRFDTSLLEREFLHTHESAIVEMIESWTSLRRSCRRTNTASSTRSRRPAISSP